MPSWNFLNPSLSEIFCAMIIQSCASPRSPYFAMLFFVNWEDLLGQYVDTVSAHQRGEFPNKYSTKHHKQGDAERCKNRKTIVTKFRNVLFEDE